ncbi:SIMPL domain-containing protein [Sphingomonas fuzhouensis]|uniref:SIMPL domain-containing protein n=1 Tax=Sphingomonas fuzhouensis TaxID=3106033 RepID=UPI002AFE5AB1|nr:SIMPL domain-containing protein [Sphingomonas sp. SGZ-02]
MVSATGVVQTPPDRVTIGFTVAGDGKTSDEAAAKVRDDAKAISAGVSGYLKGNMRWRASQFSIRPVRPARCEPADPELPALVKPAAGSCAIQGYAATMPVTIETAQVDEAGSVVSLIGRLGGQSVSVGEFGLSDPQGARRQAMRAALVNAEEQARLIAEGSGAKLGALLRVQDSDYLGEDRDMIQDRSSANAPPPMTVVAPPPIAIALAPEPIQTRVTLMVSYAIDQ